MQMATPIRLTARIDIATPGDASVANPHENPMKEKSKSKWNELRHHPRKDESLTMQSNEIGSVSARVILFKR